MNILRYRPTMWHTTDGSDIVLKLTTTIRYYLLRYMLPKQTSSDWCENADRFTYLGRDIALDGGLDKVAKSFERPGRVQVLPLLAVVGVIPFQIYD